MAARPVCAIELPSTDAFLGLMGAALVAALGAELFFLLRCEALGTREVTDDFLRFFSRFGVLGARAVSEELAGFVRVNAEATAVRLLPGLCAGFRQLRDEFFRRKLVFGVQVAVAVEPLELRPIDECGVRDDAVALLGAKIYLGLFVKAAPDWREDPQKVRELDWRFQLEGLAGDRGEEE